MSAATPPAPARIVAVGDLHGDYTAWIDVARAAGLIDRSNRWAGGAATLVQLGDIVDRGPDSLKIIRHLQQLSREAPRSGGRVVVILGNHEAMNVLGDLRYVTPGEYAAFATGQSAARREAYFAQNRDRILADYRKVKSKLSEDEIRLAWLGKTPLGWVEHREAWAPKGELGQWASRSPAIARIGDTLFVHGGISIETAGDPIERVNREVAKAMAAADDRPDSPLNNPLGPLWYRGLIATDRDAEALRKAKQYHAAIPPAQEVDRVLARYGAKRIVVGHTPAKRPIGILYGGKLARIDTAISRFYGGPLTWLEIVGETMTPNSVLRSTP